METKSKGARKRLEDQEVEAGSWWGKQGSNTMIAQRGSAVECRQIFSNFGGTRRKGHYRRF